MKFYKNKKNGINEFPSHKLDFSQFATTNNSYTTINNINFNNKLPDNTRDEKNIKCFISLPTLTVEYDNSTEMKNSFASQKKSYKLETPKIPSKMVKIQLNNPYVDIFSNKEIEFKLESDMKSSDDSERGNLCSKRKYSIENQSEKTPSFNQDMTDEIVEIISITNITQVNIPKKRNSNSVFSKTKNSTLTVPRNLSVRVRSAEKKLNSKLN